MKKITVQQRNKFPKEYAERKDFLPLFRHNIFLPLFSEIMLR